LVYWQEISSTVSISFVLRGLAGLATALNQPMRALRLFVAAEALRQDVGRSLEPVEIANDEENLKEIRSQLSQNDFDAAWAEGLAMTIEDITAYALES
jgi:hypothetical protein